MQININLPDNSQGTNEDQELSGLEIEATTSYELKIDELIDVEAEGLSFKSIDFGKATVFSKGQYPTYTINPEESDEGSYDITISFDTDDG